MFARMDKAILVPNAKILLIWLFLEGGSQKATPEYSGNANTTTDYPGALGFKTRLCLLKIFSLPTLKLDRGFSLRSNWYLKMAKRILLLQH